MMEIDFHNVNFLEDEFPSFSKIKKNLQLYKLQLDNQLALGEGENLNPHHVIKDSTFGTPPLSKKYIENLSTLENQPKRLI